MALKSPLIPSPTGGLSSAFSPYSDSPNSPAPQAFYTNAEKRYLSPAEEWLQQVLSPLARSSDRSDTLAPPPSPYPQQVDPSPVDSNGTETTLIEDDAQDDERQLKSPDGAVNGELQPSPSDIEIISPQSAGAGSERRPKIDTQLPAKIAPDNDPQSVIHAPSGFKDFEGMKSNQLSPSIGSSNTVVSPSTPEAITSPSASPAEKRHSSMSPVNTDVPRFTDRTTPRAQTRHELEEDWKRKSMRSISLEDIPETLYKDDRVDEKDDEKADSNEPDGPSTASLVDDENMSKAMEDSLGNVEENIGSLRTALSECWTLCNTLANLSSTHRQRTFKYAGKQEVQEQAWRSCWRLCQKLYDSLDEDHSSQVFPTLELCRDFCQSLFEARQKIGEAADSVLRVSFELNNHLYNTHDRTLPEAFSERTLDFYITLCHRLMKQRTSLPQETDALLRACWSLAEMLFNLRQSSREGKNPDEELLGSAVQSCWELCDLFREGWTRIRPERGTPRPTQTTFAHHSTYNSSSSRSDAQSTSSQSNRQYHDALPHSGLPPETPTTIFDDATTTASSPESATVPNIIVLGPATSGSGSLRGGTHHDRWSSNASVLSGYSESTSSQRTSSTATATTDEAHRARLRSLLLKAGMNMGYSRTSGSSLPTYVKTIPSTAFGDLEWEQTVFRLYKSLVTSDKTMEAVSSMPSRRLGAYEVAKSVRWLGNAEKWAWMRDLYRIVFGFGIDEAERRGGSFQI